MPSNHIPSLRTLFGLNWMIFCLSDVRPGIGPFLSIFLASMPEWNTSRIGLALGAMDLMAAISQVPSGWLVDSLKIKRFLIFLACLAISVGCSLILNFPKLVPVIFAQALIGIAAALLPPAIAAITLGLVGRQSFPKRISINETWGHAGNVITAASVGIVGYLLGHQWILYMVIVFASGSIFFLGFINPKEINHRVARELPEENRQPLAPMPISQLFKETHLLAFCFACFLFHLSNAAQLPLVGQFLSKMNPKIDSLFMAGCIILAQFVMIGVAYSTGFLMNRWGRKPIFLLALGVLPIRALLYTLTENPILLLSIQLLDGIGAGIYGVIAVIIISDIAKDTGRFNFSFGLMALAQGAGASASNILAGYIANQWGFNTSFIVLACIAIADLCFYGLCLPETKNQKA
ncbi:MFS transporter [Candidatus Protochlamydia phocaeensis]|uniref:MFS transporter n=1 Tax=Candidatus Protochlamydia phocaeensis TaxID=1414722 RepID=UPI000838BD1E|nr:MFS transporter [Candidatus Protochlamydia phocaeensis]